MKKIRNSLLGTSTVLLMANPALAVDTTQTYNSGILVGLFLAFCALVVVMQLIPTIILLFGFIKGLATGAKKQTSRHSNRA